LKERQLRVLEIQENEGIGWQPGQEKLQTRVRSCLKQARGEDAADTLNLASLVGIENTLIVRIESKFDFAHIRLGAVEKRIGLEKSMLRVELL
jgi:hypothetical protein